MTDPTNRTTLARKISIAVLLVLLVGLKAIPADDLETSPSDGIDDAKDHTVVVQRDPFWPVGYKPKWNTDNGSNAQIKVVAKQGSTSWDKAMEQVVIQGVSSRAGNEFYAVINSEVKSTGETVSVTVGGVSYTWMIEGISPPSSVKLRRVSAQ